MPAVNCPSKECIDSKANGRLMMQVRGSKFVKFQEIRIQELVNFNFFAILYHSEIFKGKGSRGRIIFGEYTFLTVQFADSAIFIQLILLHFVTV